MYNHQDMIRQYRQADFRQRLSLFLECPVLRNEFVRIEQNEAEKNSQESAAGNKFSRIRKFFWAFGLLKP